MSIQLTNKYDPTQPFHIYYDLDAINNETSGNNPPIRFSITDVRNIPYLNSPENYFMSVIRFTIQTPTLPVFIPQILLGQVSVDKTAYSFTLSFPVGGTTINSTQTFIVYVPSDTTQATPAQPLTIQDMTSDYYYVYNLQDWCKMMNTALSSAFTSLNANVIAAGGTLPSANVPFFEWNPVQQVFILSADNASFNSSLASPIKIFCNTALYTLLNNFPIIKFAPSGVALGKNYQFEFYNNNGLNLFNMGAYSVIQLYQDNSTTGLFNPVQSIVFTTSLLPIVPSVVSIPKIFNSSTFNLSSVGNNSNIAPIITDFQIPYSATNQYRPNLTYTPQSEYRLIDLYGLSPQSSLEISVLWKDNFGGNHVFLLGAGCSASVKLMFRRKDFNTSRSVA
jgi:hypothetical protein